MSAPLSIVGLAPPAVGALALWPSNPSDAPSRLIDLINCTTAAYAAVFDRRNLHGEPLTGDEPADREAGAELQMGLDRPVVVLGRRAWRGLGLPANADLYDHGVYRSVHTHRLLDATLWPHPSSRNRQWNCDDFRHTFRLRARARLRREGFDLPLEPPVERLDPWEMSAAELAGEAADQLEALRDREREVCCDRVGARVELTVAWEHGYRGKDGVSGEAMYRRQLKWFVTEGRLPLTDGRVLRWLEAAERFLG